MQELRFVNREKEIEDIEGFLKSVPNSILFIYGPKSSGKTTLLLHVIGRLGEGAFKTYYYDLRREGVGDRLNLMEILFKKGGARRVLNNVMKAIGGFGVNVATFGFTLPKPWEGKEPTIGEVFDAMEKEFLKVRNEGRVPVMIIDELHMLKEVYFNNNGRSVFEELMNFFVSMTKVQHLCHLIATTSDVFFINEIWKDSKLEEVAKYYLVDYLEYDDVAGWLAEEGFTPQEIEFLWEHLGGKIWSIQEVIQAKRQDKKVEDVVLSLYHITYAKLMYLLATLFGVKRRTTGKKAFTNLPFCDRVRTWSKY